MDSESAISRCKLLYVRWIKSKVLLYSRGSYSQYPVINHNGKEKKNRSRFTDIENKLLVTKGKRRGWRSWEIRLTDINYHT